jgi:hypothetical protein
VKRPGPDEGFGRVTGRSRRISPPAFGDDERPAALRNTDQPPSHGLGPGQFAYQERTTPMNTPLLRAVQCSVVALSLLTASPASAWLIKTQNSLSQVWSGYASAANNKLAEGWHPTAVDVNYTAYNNSHTKLALCLVKKEGVFNISAKILYDKTWQEIADWAEDYGYTVVDHDEYLKGGDKRYAAVLHKLDPFQPWFAFTEQNTPSLAGFVAGSGGHVIDLDLEEDGNASFLFGTIHFNNSYSGVVWDSTVDWDDIWPYCQQYNKRILDISRRQDGRYCVLFCDEKLSEAGKWGYFGNASYNWLKEAQENGWRVQKRNTFSNGDTTTYSGVLVRKL